MKTVDGAEASEHGIGFGGEGQPNRDEAVVLAEAAYEKYRHVKIPILNEEMPYCNDKCMHCGVADIMKGATMMPLETVVAHLKAMVPVAQGRVMFAVSEVTIRPDFVSIVRAAKALGYTTIAIVTNGRRFSYMPFTERTVAAGATHFLVSLYGPDPKTHVSITRTPESFEQTSDGIRNLVASGVQVMTNTVITRRNVSQLEETVSYIHDLGVQRSSLSFVQKIGDAKRYAAQLIPTWKETVPQIRRAVERGEAAGMTMGIGGLPPCLMPDLAHCFGVDDLTWIHNGEPGDQITHRSPYHYAEPCGSCASRVVCHGVQEEALGDEDMAQLVPFPGPIWVRRPTSKLGVAMFPELFVPRD